MTIWANQNLEFNYYFPDPGSVFTGSPISFVADGSSHLSTLSNLSPATFSVTGIAPDAVQIAYFYPVGSFNLSTSAFNGFIISGPVADSPIVAAFVDSGSTVPDLTNATVSFDANTVTVTLAGDAFPAGSIGLIDVQFAVPEPGSLLLLAPGLVVVFGIARLKRFRSVWARWSMPTPGAPPGQGLLSWAAPARHGAPVAEVRA